MLPRALTVFGGCAARAARNMGFQDVFGKFGSPECLLTIKGKDLLGCAVKAPLTKYEKIYMLPLTTISMTKGTAIVTSVPSDSPDDYAAFMDLKNAKKREFYGVQAEWVEPFTSGYGEKPQSAAAQPPASNAWVSSWGFFCLPTWGIEPIE